MARPSKYGSDAERRAVRLAAQRARREAKTPAREAKTPTDEAKTPNREAKTPGDEAKTPRREAKTLWHAATGFVGCRDVAGVPHDPCAEPWAGVGRGVPTEWRGDRYVLVARGQGTHDVGEHAVVTEADWLLRHDQRCQHGLRGWSCHVC